MAGIATVYRSIISKLNTDIPQVTYIRKWNNQVDLLVERKIYLFPMPSIFVEIQAPTNYMPLGRGYSASDLNVRIHILHEEYDAGNGNYEENFNVYEYRNAVNKSLNSFMPDLCGCLMHTSESEDFVHNNVYHYTIDFICGFIDDTGSKDVQEITTTPTTPIELQINTDVEQSIPNEINITPIKYVKLK